MSDTGPGIDSIDPCKWDSSQKQTEDKDVRLPPSFSSTIFTWTVGGWMIFSEVDSNEMLFNFILTAWRIILVDRDV